MKILLCPSAYFPHWGGVEELTKNLAVRLANAGHRVVIATNRHPSGLPQSEILDGIEVRRLDFVYPARSPDLPARLWRMAKTKAEYQEFVSSFAPDIVHIICAGPVAFYTWLLPQNLRSQIILSFCGELFMDSDQIYQRSRFARWALKKVLAQTQAITAVSNYVLQDARSRFTLPAVPQAALYPAIEIESYVKPPLKDGDFSCSSPFVLSVGRFVENKGFEDLINAFKLIATKFKSTKLIIAGRGPLYERYLALGQKLELEDQLIVLNNVERNLVLNLYEDAELFVLPSPVEPFALVTLEAMRAGKPVIATNSGGSPELVKHGVNGLLYEPGSVNELAINLERLLKEDASESRQMGAAARLSVEDFDWTKRLDDYVKLYDLTASGKTGS